MRILELIKNNSVEFVMLSEELQSVFNEVFEDALSHFERELKFTELFDQTMNFVDTDGYYHSFDISDSIFYDEHRKDMGLIYKVSNAENFQFCVPLHETKGARFLAEDKAIFFMRWIRKEMEKLLKDC